MSLKLDQVIESLRQVRDPNTQKDVLSSGFVRDVKIDGDTVSLKLNRPALSQPVREALTRAGAGGVNLIVEGGQHSHGPAAAPKPQTHVAPGVKHLIAVASGKGGVGKSTVSANLATALAKLGARVGLMDCDILGPNIPTMMGIHEPPQARMDDERGELILPLEAHGVKIMSMGFLTRGDQPLVWRGPMLHSVVSQFLTKVDWGTLDYLIVDMPPGTGDVQISLTQLASLSGAVVVTTPQEVALEDVRKAVLMLEKVSVPILGVVENMSYFVCDNCDAKHEIFGAGGGQALADKYHLKLLSRLPLEPKVRMGGDSGAPSVISAAETPAAKAFLELARKVIDEVNQRAESSVEIQGF